jgi:hypothetical protein
LGGTYRVLGVDRGGLVPALRSQRGGRYGGTAVPGSTVVRPTDGGTAVPGSTAVRPTLRRSIGGEPCGVSRILGSGLRRLLLEAV